MLIDSHCHLNFKDLAADSDGVVARARSAGVGHIVNICTMMGEFPEVLATAKKYDDVTCTVGLHPHEASQGVTAEALIKAAEDPKVIGIGEAGLDFHYDYSPRDVQEKVFREHIRACLATGFPLVVHTREAEADTMRIINEENDGKLTGVMHCFSSSRKLAEEALAIGFYISFSGILTFKNSQNVRDIAKDVPLDRLLVETDSPYLAPLPYRGKPCQPAYVVETARVLAEVKGVSFDEISSRTTENFYRLFKKAPR